jgi:hypothetical protein
MKSVHELSAEELQELRSRWYHQHLDDGTLEEVVGREVQDEEEIPMDIVIAYYEGTYFVEEDFWCNLGGDEEPLFMCNSCHDHFPREEMDFDVDDDQDLCKNCNYQTYNEAPYGQD